MSHICARLLTLTGALALMLAVPASTATPEQLVVTASSGPLVAATSTPPTTTKPAPPTATKPPPPTATKPSPPTAAPDASGTKSATSPKPYGVPGNWTLKWQDSFSGNSLNSNKWRANWLGSGDSKTTKPFNSRELSCYDPRQVSVSDGSARLRAEKRSCTTTTGKRYPYASGIIQSSADFWFTYGYAEIRMYLPPNQRSSVAALGSCGPNWAAFWLNGAKWPSDGEIDVLECLGKDNVTWNYHWAGGKVQGKAKGWNGDMPGESGWHRFGVDWERGSLAFYYDGVKVGTSTGAVTSSPHYIVANLSISGTKITIPQTVQIDHIRVWQHP
jgi:beta-glucanase (GH16 family)